MRKSSEFRKQCGYGCEGKMAKRLDDAALQLYKDGDYSSYLDLDSSIAEQHEEFDNFQFKYVQLIAYDIQPKQP
ncbi:hypothetical protein V9T40_006243 [Parthenolecanium corni]|uniref:FHOD1 N-terminal GTPase-binding domain-containing protein n=1 Tax=Parthenolecanium corni TaxID=536013 RepID=A0AAN9YBE1_9HEMI